MNQISFLKVSFALSALLAGCGASGGDDGNGGNGNSDGGAGGECVKVTDTEANCANGIDDNCDGLIDCENTECSFDPFCTGGGGGGGGGGGEDCGELSFGGAPLAIPDGNGTAYETSLNIGGFDNGQTLDTADGFESICVTMEHSWLRDLQIELVSPSNQIMVLQQYLGQTGNEVFMGVPNDDDGTDPVPGTGAQYCWKQNATNEPMLDWATANAPLDPIFGFPGSVVLPAGDYRPSGMVGSDLVGSTLNGEWTIRVVDDWASDNGYIFDWSITFSEDIIPDCLIIID
ncbi:MAG: proprotein convertase P-domain-containing protein [Kofleriaceae bacterium]|nr:proprotein convertase P-domain-containing protein [Kofleriaceae bacterium]